MDSCKQAVEEENHEAAKIYTEVFIDLADTRILEIIRSNEPELLMCIVDLFEFEEPDHHMIRNQCNLWVYFIDSIHNLEIREQEPDAKRDALDKYKDVIIRLIQVC